MPHFSASAIPCTEISSVRTCQLQQNDKNRCSFFLWDTDAQVREAAALATNSRTEPGRTEPDTPSRRRNSPPPPYTVETEPAESSRKRPRPSVDFDDEYGLGQDDSAFNAELDHVMTAVETPSKAVKISDFATPATRRKLPWQTDKATSSNAQGLQTPQTGSRVDDPFNTRPVASGSGAYFTPTKINQQDDDEHQIATPSSSFETPTPNRFKNVIADNLVKDVFDLLQESNVRLSSSTHNDLKSLLSKHAKGAEGFKRGRDVIRATVKAKDAKITELTYRVSTLEAELEAEKAMVRHLQWEAGSQPDDS